MTSEIPAMTTTPSLPTLEDCVSILSDLLSKPQNDSLADLTKWRETVHRCLEYGTVDPSASVVSTITSCEPTESTASIGITNAESAAKLIGDSIEWYAVRKIDGNVDDYDEQNDAVLNTVIESLWCLACLSKSHRHDADTSVETQPLTVTKEDAYSRLLHIVSHLTSRTISHKPPDDSAMQLDEKDKSNEGTRPLLPPSLFQTSLEFSLLEDANLIPPAPKSGPSSVKGRYMKINANLYYRQQKFNLLVEEGEGYAKLLGYFLSGIGGDYNGDDDGTATTQSLTKQQQHVLELIGTFDLDPNRVLDLALDSLEWELNQLIKMGGTIISPSAGGDPMATPCAGGEEGMWKLENVRNALRMSSRSSPSVVSRKRGVIINKIRSLLEVIRELDGNTANGGRAIPHLLGFKYRMYGNRANMTNANKSTSAVNPTTPVGTAVPPVTPTTTATATVTASTINGHPPTVYPPSLHLLTAFLSTHGLLDIHTLLPSITGDNNPTPIHLLASYRTYCTDTIARLKKLGVVSLNSKKSDGGEKEKEQSQRQSILLEDKFRDDPITGIFRFMIALSGDWDSTVGFLAHAFVEGFEDMVMASSGSENGGDSGLQETLDRVALAMCSLSDVVASDVCAWISSAVDGLYRESCSAGSNGSLREEDSRSLLSTSVLDVMFLPKDCSLEELSRMLLSPLSCLVGSGKIQSNHALYMKLCSLYRAKLAALKPTDVDAGEIGPTATVSVSSIDTYTIAVLSTFLVPSLSLFPSDPTLSRELWSVLQLLPYSIRYKLYSAWRSPSLEKGALRSLSPRDIELLNIPKPLGIIESEIKTAVEAKSIMKRISKDNIRAKGIELAKTSHNNPLVVFSYVLNQIESYDNMILMMVDTFQFVTALGLDVIGYCLLLSLGGGDDGSGQRSRTKLGGLNTEQWLTSLETFTGAFYKRFPDVELRGLLLYLTQRMKEGHASELGVLRSLIKTAGGYGFVDYDSTSALSELQLDGRCGSRLLKLETSSFGVVDDVNPRASRKLRSVLQGGNLGVIMLILLSKIRQQILYSKADSKEHIKVIGSMYDNCASVLCLLLEYVSDSSDDLPSGPSTKEMFANSMPSLGRLCETYRLDPAVAWMLTRPLVRKSMFFMDDSKLVGKSSSGEPPSFLKRFTPSPEMTKSYQKLLSESAWKSFSPVLFEAFFSLSVYDIRCPTERYNIEIQRLKKECERLTHLQKGGSEARGAMAAMAAAVAASGGNQDQIRRATEFTKSHAIELDRLKRNVEKLANDFSRQQKRCDIVRAKLDAQKDKFVQSNGTGDEDRGIDEMFASRFMTFCIYPRCLLSPEDSLFCAYFVKLLHTMKVPGFSIIELVDIIVNAATGSLYCVTEDEAGNLAIFLHEIWKSVNSWRYDNDSFTSELKGTPGSRLSKRFAQEKNIDNHATIDGITHDDYKAIYTQWHLKIGSASIGCLNSTEYMHTRSALIVLSRIVSVYPTQPKVGEKILETLASLQKEDNPRADIRATAQGYASQLMKARDEGMWKEENIAVTKARQEREQMKVEERRKKLAKQHEDMKKESEMISRELGDTWRRDGRNDSRGRQWTPDQRMVNSMPMAPHMNPHAPTFTPRDGSEVRELNNAGQRRDGHDHGRQMDSRRSATERSDLWERDRGSGPPPSRHQDSRGHSRPGSHTGSVDGHDNRRHAGEDSGRARRKRSRSPEPGEDTERDASMQKRYRHMGRGSSPPAGNRSSDLQQSGRADRRQERRSGSGRH